MCRRQSVHMVLDLILLLSRGSMIKLTAMCVMVYVMIIYACSDSWQWHEVTQRNLAPTVSKVSKSTRLSNKQGPWYLQYKNTYLPTLLSKYLFINIPQSSSPTAHSHCGVASASVEYMALGTYLHLKNLFIPRRWMEDIIIIIALLASSSTTISI